ncbi:MAG TPA: RDD family protein [Thermoanaerobaculia bacterium]
MPRTAAEPFAAIGDRMLALILDRVVIVALLAIPAALLVEHWSQLDSRLTAPLRVTIAAAMIVLIVVLAYHIVLEALFGATLGKGLLGLQVRNGAGDRPWLTATIRNLLRLIDALLFYALAFLFAAFSPRRQRVGDLVAGTTVIEQHVDWGARIALILIWVALVAGCLWLAAWLCPSCLPDLHHFAS